jgi:hypothetical protein
MPSTWMKASGGIETLPILFHLLFALLLLVEELALAGDVAAVAFRGDVLAHLAHVVAGDDLAADRGLDRDLEHLRRDDLGELLAQVAALPLGLGPVHDARKGVHRLAVHEDVHLHQVGRPVLAELVVHRAVAAGDALQAVVEIDEDFVERQRAAQHDARGVERVGVVAGAALLHDEIEDVAQESLGMWIDALIVGS